MLDFDLAKTLAPFHGTTRATITRQGEIVGTVSYMSPELAEGKTVDERSDLFSIGIIFYETLTDRYPFGGDSLTAHLSSILRDEPPSVRLLRPDVPERLSRLIDHLSTRVSTSAVRAPPRPSIRSRSSATQANLST